MRYEMHNLDGQGTRRTQVFDVPLVNPHDYWANVTDIPCPYPECSGTVRWAEAGYVPGYRICDDCGRHFLAKGTREKPALVRVGKRRSKV